MFCTTKEEVKATVRKGQMAHGDRQIGKTQGLLEVIHEDYQGTAILVVPLHNLVGLVKDRYKRSFPKDVQPHVCVPMSLQRLTLGRDLPVFVDTFNLVPDHDREQVHQILHGRVAGVW